LSKVFKSRYVIVECPPAQSAASQAAASAAAHPASLKKEPSAGNAAGPLTGRSAQEEAKKLLDQAKISGRVDGFEEGYKLGIAESAARMNNELFEIRQELENACEAARLKNTQACMELKNGQPALAMRLAAKILRHEVNNNEKAFLNLFENAASHIAQTDSAVLKAGPQGYETAVRLEKELEKSINGVKTFEIKLFGRDNGLCIIETPYGSIDASVDTQLEKAARTMGLEEF
jgi:flagellar assembly protein FliH